MVVEVVLWWLVLVVRVALAFIFIATVSDLVESSSWSSRPAFYFTGGGTAAAKFEIQFMIHVPFFLKEYKTRLDIILLSLLLYSSPETSFHIILLFFLYRHQKNRRWRRGDGGSVGSGANA